ncbi:MAG TPA: tetratricopeptide repeat protein [Bacteroidia bacterium]|jgi:tetratricopeptide (TPR) repeat protein|nr:tetratricopeptide repeat protein [Bacteroidia bacterium]
MFKLPIRLSLFFLFAGAGSSFAQTQQIDSLTKVVNTLPDDDTNKVIAMYRLAGKLISSDSKKALDYGLEAQRLSEKLNFRRGIASSLNNIGIIYENSGDFERAADCFIRSLQIKEEIGNVQGMANSYANLGEVFDEQGNYEKALYYYYKSLDLSLREHDTSALVNSYLDIGVVEAEKDSIPAALADYRRSIGFALAIGDSSNLDDNYSNIGVVYQDMKMLDSAQFYYVIATIIRERMHDKYGLLNSYNNLGSVGIELGNFKEAEQWYLKAIELQREVKSLSSLQSSYHGLSDVYDSLNDPGRSLDYLRKYNVVHDSLFDLRSAKAINAMELKYEQDKKEKEEKIKQEAEERQRRTVLGFLIAITLLVSGFSIFLFNRFRVIRRQKILIEVKNKEITDSINYAKRLQEAILPPRRMVQELFPESFIFYRPKDIVAGDFYWVMENGDDLFFAVADCTGHGVPGAMVSFVCSNALDRAVKEFELKDPGKILDKVTELLLDTFRKSEEEVKDGMDISLCHVHQHRTKLSFAGAHNSCWIIRNGELITLEADNQPVGKYDNLKPFRSHTFDLQKNDGLYLGTDGYSDQFGGEKGKKFKTANVRKMLIVNADRPMKEQLEIMSSTFEKWRGNLEQVDDVCVMGVKF